MTSGQPVSMNPAGDRVAIGAVGNDGTASNAGHVRVISTPLDLGLGLVVTSMAAQ